MRACERVCARACVSVCVCVHARACVCVCVCVCAAGVASQESDVTDVKKTIEAVAHGNAMNAEIAEKIRDVRSGKHKGTKRARKRVQFDSTQTWDVNNAQALLPENYKIFKDDFNARWRVHIKSGSSVWSSSKSWGVSGDDGPCVRHCVKQAWARHTLLHGEACPFEGL